MAGRSLMTIRKPTPPIAHSRRATRGALFFTRGRTTLRHRLPLADGPRLEEVAEPEAEDRHEGLTQVEESLNGSDDRMPRDEPLGEEVGTIGSVDDTVIVYIALVVLHVALAIAAGHVAYRGLEEIRTTEPVPPALSRDESMAERLFSLLATFFERWTIARM
jgi:hypothetical protein